MIAQRVCDKCCGSGVIQITPPLETFSDGRMFLYYPTCKACGGTGFIVRTIPYAKREGEKMVDVDSFIAELAHCLREHPEKERVIVRGAMSINGVETNMVSLETTAPNNQIAELVKKYLVGFEQIVGFDGFIWLWEE